MLLADAWGTDLGLPDRVKGRSRDEAEGGARDGPHLRRPPVPRPALRTGGGGAEHHGAGTLARLRRTDG